MIRKSLALCLLFLVYGMAPSVFGEDERKLIWTYPCAFAYNDSAKTPYTHKITRTECDFLHAQFGENSAHDFNDFTLPAQNLFLKKVIRDASRADMQYNAAIKLILQRTDPASISPDLLPEARLKKLVEFSSFLHASSFASFQPFQWEKPEALSYMDTRGGQRPKSWGPYLAPFKQRDILLNRLIMSLQGQLVSEATAKLSSWVNVVGKPKILSSDDERWLARIYKEPPKTQEAPLPGPRAILAKPGRKTLAPLTLRDMPYSPKLPVPAPLPQTVQQQAKYGTFNRGSEAGMQRIADETKIAFWHATGQTRTIGDPVGKSALAFYQKSGSCALAAQIQALEARGKIAIRGDPSQNDATMRSFVKQAHKAGFFVEIRDKNNGLYTGTSPANINKMLIAFKASHIMNLKATQEDLDRALLRSGDAIVAVDAGIFWNIPQHIGHAVYLTGTEVDSSGKIIGYYCNDTGTGEGARFITKADFNKAWLHILISFQDHGH